MDEKGTLAVPVQFDDVMLFEENVARVKIGDKWGIISRSGKSLAETVSR